MDTAKRTRDKELDLFFRPRSIAVVGATPTHGKGGYSIIANLLESFQGKVYPVNPRREEVLGEKCYPTVAHLPEAVDLAIIFTPAKEVPRVVEDCARAGVGAVLIESGGFSEVGEEGARMQRSIVKTARASGMRVWGPNCTGLVNTRPFLFTPFMRLPDAHIRIEPGNLGIIAQSGMMAAGFMVQYIISGYFKTSKACAIGNKSDVDETEVLSYLSEDRDTQAIVMYLESIVRGREFLEVARSTASRKPLVVLKSGRNEQSALAAMSHTGSMAGEEEVVEGALRQAGIIRVEDFHQLMALGKAFSLNPQPFRLTTPEGNRVAIITVTGGGGVVTTDLLHDENIMLARLSPSTLKALEEIFPPWMGPSNPVDIWPAMEQKGFSAWSDSFKVVMEDPGVDGILALPFSSRMVKEFPFKFMGDMVRRCRKPVVSWVFGDVRFFAEFTAEMERVGIPVFTDLKTCSLAMSAYLRFAMNRR